MASPSTKAELITYAKRQLGEPVLQVNVDDEQVNNVIDDTFQFFQENCYNGMERCYLVHEITADDKTRLAATTDTTKVDAGASSCSKRPSVSRPPTSFNLYSFAFAKLVSNSAI